MARRRQIIGGLTSVLLHGGLLAWAVTRAPLREPAAAMPVEVERIEVASLAGRPLALQATEGSPGEGASDREPARGEAVTHQPEPEPAASEPRPPKRRATQPRPRTPAAPSPAPKPVTSTPAPVEDEIEVEIETERSEPASSPAAAVSVDRARSAGTDHGRGTGRSITGHMGTGDSPDHSAYGAELVRLVKAEIDTDPVPGLRPHDAVEVVLEVLPSGRLARRGLGKYDYARVVHSTVGRVRLRMILRRILRASYEFPPHPSSFPRERYVVGFTVRFRDRHG